MADPSGHSVFDWLFSSIVDLLEIIGGVIAGIYGAEPVAGALIGAGTGGLLYDATTLATGQSFTWGGWAISEGIGAVTGLSLGFASAAGEAGIAGEVGEVGEAGEAEGGANEEGGNAQAANAGGGQPGATSIYNLSADLRNHIASFLDDDDIVSWRQTGRLFRRVAWDDSDRMNNLARLPEDERNEFMNRIERVGYKPLEFAGVSVWDYLDVFDNPIVKDDPDEN
jgi:hypothetical protein